MQKSVKKILFICRDSAYSNIKAQENLDILLMASTFDQEISLLFLDDGILQLKKNQQPENILQKKFSAAYQALSLYDINKVYVEQKSLQQRHLDIADLIISVTIMDDTEIKKLIAEQDIIIT